MQLRNKSNKNDLINMIIFLRIRSKKRDEH